MLITLYVYIISINHIFTHYSNLQVLSYICSCYANCFISYILYQINRFAQSCLQFVEAG